MKSAAARFSALSAVRMDEFTKVMGRGMQLNALAVREAAYRSARLTGKDKDRVFARTLDAVTNRPTAEALGRAQQAFDEIGEKWNFAKNYMGDDRLEAAADTLAAVNLQEMANDYARLLAFQKTGPTVEAFERALNRMRFGLQFIQEIVWNPSSRQASSKSRFSIKSERWMYWIKPGGTRTFNLDAVKEPPKPGDKRNNKHYSLPVDVWTFNKVNGNSKKRTAHPCPFPDDMIERIVLACSNLGDLVMDPFGGSGTTAVAAQLHQRSAILLEQSAEYCEIARKRVA